MPGDPAKVIKLLGVDGADAAVLKNALGNPKAMKLLGTTTKDVVEALSKKMKAKIKNDVFMKAMKDSGFA
jgi:hypothetical protein